MDSADTEGVSGCRLFGCLLLFDVVRCCSMSWRMIATGAPPHEAAKSDGDQKVWFEPRHPRSRLGRVQAATGVQNGLERRHFAVRCVPSHQSDLSVLRPGRQRKPAQRSRVLVCRLWSRRQCRCGGRNQYFRARVALVGLCRGRLWPGS